MRRNAAFSLVLLVCIAVAAAPALAGKGGSGGSGGGGGGTPPPSSSIAIASVDGVAAAPTKAPTLKLGDTMTFATTVAPVAGWESPMVVLSCYQDVNGDGVVDTSLGGPDIVYSWLDNPGAVFSLSGQGQTSRWTLRGGGPATCRADLDAYGWKSNQESVRLLATTGNFAVSG
jgi:hypothetical protein